MSLNSLIFSGDEYDPADAARANPEYRWLHPSERKELYLLQKGLEEQRKKDTRSPLQKFKEMLSRDCLMRLLNHRVIEDGYIFKNPRGPNNLIFTIETWNIDGVEESKRFVLYLRRFYIVSAQRGKGYAKEFIKWIKLCSEVSGMVICLVASNYELSANNTDEGGFFTETLLEAIELDSHQIIHHIDLNQEYIEDFYRNEGFINGQILPPKKDGYSCYSTSQQFIYIPKSISKDNLKEIKRILV